MVQGAESKAGGERDEGALLQDEQDMLSTSFSGERMGLGGVRDGGVERSSESRVSAYDRFCAGANARIPGFV